MLLGHIPVYVVTDADLAHDVLAEQAGAFKKSVGLQFLRPMLGDGLLLSEGETHKRHRKLLAPAVARRFPELASLGFFLRRGEIAKALKSLETEGDDVFRFPRGLVFHVPPANVDTIFVYSWALSALAGNPNVVRISSRSAGAAETVLEALNEALAEADPIIARTQRMVTYGRDDAVTSALSAACELRVIWGGDAAVTASLPQVRTEVKLGLDVQDLTAGLAEKFKLHENKGVLVTKVEPGSLAQSEGLREGDLIKEVNRSEVHSVGEFTAAVARVRRGDTVLLRIQRENRAFYVVLKTTEK